MGVKRIWGGIRRQTPTIIEVVGLFAVAAGAAMIFLPAGIILAGLAAVFVAQGLEGGEQR